MGAGRLRLPVRPSLRHRGAASLLASARELALLVPDVARLGWRLARDSRVPRRAKWSLVLLAGYLALPFDLVPDFIPVLGQLDDALVALLILRYALRRAGPEVVREQWPGSERGLAVVLRIAAGAATA